MKVIVTGGAGYIGSHTALALISAGHDVIIADNFSNSRPEAVERLRKLAGKDFDFIEADLCNKSEVNGIFKGYKADAVMHFAGFKAVGESKEIPLTYYQNNLVSTLNLLEAMQSYGVRRFIFSSSATVYGEPASLPIREDFPLSATNAYGRTKLMIEEILFDASQADAKLGIGILRYFNPVGAHSSGILGEDPNGVPNNLMPCIAMVATRKRERMDIFGNDYDTPDGTGVRDYIHVTDLADGHVSMLEKLRDGQGIYTYNLGTGRGYSVLEMIREFERASGKTIGYEMKPRRAGDVAACYADPSKAREGLGWQASKGLTEMCEDTWRFWRKNPNGYIADNQEGNDA